VRAIYNSLEWFPRALGFPPNVGRRLDPAGFGRRLDQGGSMTNGRVMLTGAALALAGAIAAAQAPQASGAKTTAPISGKGITGEATLVERKQGTGVVVDVTVSASGLTPGLHGVHLHAVGKCEPDFAAAGGHFDPGPASNPDPDVNHPFHMGDIPNLEVGKDGKGTLKAVTTRVTVSAGPLSIHDADGTAIIIHGNEDKGVPGEPKSGVSGGPRVACGVFSK
jgi:Cu-Zn family superoxide dismutase